MAADPQRQPTPEPTPEPTASSSRDRLPFEPGKARKQTAKAPKVPATVNQTADKTVKGRAKSVRSNESTAIPEAVSQRMIRRMALFCGIPTVLGISTFFVSYFVVTNGLVELPHVAVVLVSMGFFGLGVLGLSYGVLSASWDEDAPGSAIGWSEFATNLGRMTEAWRSSGNKS